MKFKIHTFFDDQKTLWTEFGIPANETLPKGFVSIRSVRSWVFHIVDIFSDINYLRTVPMHNKVFKNVMLLTIIFPPAVNLIYFPYYEMSTEGCSLKDLFRGVFNSFLVNLGLFELI